MKFWQGHDVDELLICLVAAIFFICLTLGCLNVALATRPHWWEVVR